MAAARALLSKTRKCFRLKKRKKKSLALGFFFCFLRCASYSLYFQITYPFPRILCYRHEIVGIVTDVGSNVDKFKVGEKVGVGYMVDSCLSCDSCTQDYENYCDKVVNTSNGIFSDGTKTYGGFSDAIVVKERFVVHIPESLPLDKTAPLLCAGVTVYSPMKYFGLNESGKHLGVVGLGGLGHLAVKFGKAFGMKVTVISSSPSKEKEAVEHLGADSFLVSRSPEQMQVKKERRLNFCSTFQCDF